jgi:hypothetical protein
MIQSAVERLYRAYLNYIRRKPTGSPAVPGK